jgi:signal transduction histidine kinase/ActR/RegA family two-component response regulator
MQWPALESPSGVGVRIPVGHPRGPQAVLWVSQEGEMLAPPLGDERVLGTFGSSPNITLDSVFGSEGARILLDRVRGCESLRASVAGEMDLMARGEPRKLYVVVAPAQPVEGRPAYMVSVHDPQSPKSMGDIDVESQNWQSTVGLASGIAHRFNNLLVAITGNVGLLRSSLPEGHPDLAAIADMEDAAREMAGLTRHLLAYAGGGKYCARPISINQSVENVLNTMDPRCYPNIRWVKKLRADVPMVEADLSQIDQSILNIVMNAVEAIGEGAGSIEISTERITSSNWVESDGMPAPSVKLTITDDGPGMSEAVRARVFEPFFTTKAPGRGLGLPAVSGIVRGHEGTVRLQTAPGGPTCIEICLPGRTASASARPHAAPSDWRRITPRSVLIVDDDKGSLRVLQRAFDAQGFTVVVASDGQRALAVAKERKSIDLCVVDMGLPDTTGDYLCAQLKELMPATRVLMCSGYCDPGLVDRVLTAGADGFLQKPFGLQELEAKVQEILPKSVRPGST